jgi:hypothetical protein
MSVDVSYSPPVRKDICIAYCYYNPGGDPVVLANAQALETKLKNSSIPYFNVEVIFNGEDACLVNPTLTLSTNSALFYKESAWNLLEKKIPSEFTKICFMDVNLSYSRTDWLDCLSLMLNFYDVIQPFNEIHYVDASGAIVKTDTAAVKNGSLDNVYDNIWGMTRTFFKKVEGFLDRSVVSPNLLYPAIIAPDVSLEMPLIDGEYKKYATTIKETGCNIRYLNCPLFSFPNGSLGDIHALNTVLKSVTADWASSFSLNASGLWEVNDANLKAAFKALYDRKEVLAEHVVEPEHVVEVATVIPSVVPVAEPKVVPAAVPVEPRVVPAVVPAVVPVVPKAVPVVPKAVPVAPKAAPVAPKAAPVSTPFVASPAINPMINAPAAVKNDAARAAAAALVASFKRR